MSKNDSKGKELESLASEVSEQMNINKFLNKQLDKFIFFNNITKDIMTNSIQDKNRSLISLFKGYAEIIRNEEKKYKNYFEKNNSKYNLLKEQYIDNVSIKEILSEINNKGFALNYLLIEKNNTINAIKNSIKLSKINHLSREPIRDNFLEINKSNKEMERSKCEFQQNLYAECKGCNKKDIKINKYKIKKPLLSKNIKVLEEYIKSTKLSIKKIKNNKIKNPEPFIYSERLKNNLKFEEISKKEKKENKTKKNIISDFKRLEDLFDISSDESENEIIIDEELHSDEDYNFTQKIHPSKQLSTIYLNNIKSTIPKFNFNQLNYNKSKSIYEIDLYSLERRNYKNKTIDQKIKDIKKNISKIANKIEKNKQKEKIMSEYIIKLKEKYNDIKPMIYQQTTFDIQTSDLVSKSLKASEIILDKNNEKEETIDSILSDENDKNINNSPISGNSDQNNEKKKINNNNDKKEEIKDMKKNINKLMNIKKYVRGAISGKNMNMIGKKISMPIIAYISDEIKQEKNYLRDKNQPFCILNYSRVYKSKLDTERPRSK